MWLKPISHRWHTDRHLGMEADSLDGTWYSFGIALACITARSPLYVGIKAGTRKLAGRDRKSSWHCRLTGLKEDGPAELVHCPSKSLASQLLEQSPFFGNQESHRSWLRAPADRDFSSAHAPSGRENFPEMENDTWDRMEDRNEKKDRKRTQNRVAQRLYRKYNLF